MAQVGNNEDRFSGEFMVQDRDHLGEAAQPKDKANRAGVRQVDQAQTEDRQQGGDSGTGRQQGQRRRQVL